MSTTETKVRLQGGDILTVWTSETRDEARARINAAAVASIIESHADMLEALEQAAKLMPLGTAIRAEWLTRTSAILARVRGIA